eukprot:TRINITY_DN39925_c0_g1_i2.p1 TRINITY_DN39925_c0_g1~~TRINITY_DN39925_c0_g1_i2.p1  ORF type:complete len:483 (-),score=132.63 TRINITY_DN39925_c0_g1_i2:42-1490(-)
MEGWENALNSIIKTTEKNLVEFRTHNNPIAYDLEWEKENMPVAHYSIGRDSNSHHTDFHSQLTRTEATLKAEIDRNARDVDHKLEAVRQEFRTNSTGRELTSDLWESTERRLLLLSEKVHAVESRSFGSTPGIGEVSSDAGLRIAQLERVVAELQARAGGSTGQTPSDLYSRVDQMESRLTAHMNNTRSELAAIEAQFRGSVRGGVSRGTEAARLGEMIQGLHHEADDENMLAQMALIKTEIASCKIENSELDERLGEAESAIKKGRAHEHTMQVNQDRIEALEASLRSVARRGPEDSRVVAQVEDLLGVAHAHASRIQEQDSMLQQLAEANKQLEATIATLPSAKGKPREGGLHDDPMLFELSQKLMEAGESSSGDRAQLTHCCEMVVKLGNKSIEEAQKMDQLTELVTLMQSRLSEIGVQLGSEKRERESLQREVSWWIEGQKDGLSDDLEGLDESNISDQPSPSFQLSDLSPMGAHSAR